MEPSIDVHLLAPVDWPVLKEARLMALQDSPHAFMARYEQECRWGEPEWRSTYTAATWIVAREARSVIALTKSVIEQARPRVRYLESIWVAPTHRRRGIFRCLLDALAEVERHLGVTRLLLWVLEDNHVARRVYEALGFVATGERQFLPHLGRFELQLALNLQE